MPRNAPRFADFGCVQLARADIALDGFRMDVEQRAYLLYRVEILHQDRSLSYLYKDIIRNNMKYVKGIIRNI
jgi:hypothetical protein